MRSCAKSTRFSGGTMMEGIPPQAFCGGDYDINFG
jgi:hypothetical protein